LITHTVVVKVRLQVDAIQYHLGVSQKFALARKKRAINSLSVVVRQIRADKGAL
jgi:hypothetical protein